MKILAVLFVAISTASALGSGPYLPSGWRPDGPAFFLPGEVKTSSSDNPLKETLFQESEASGSDFLREYGPPKVQEVSQDITQQGLPDVVTEQSFNIEAKLSPEVNEEITENSEVTQNKAIVVTEAVTDSSTVASELVTVPEDQVTVEVISTEQPIEEEMIQGRAIKLEIEASIAETTDGFVEAAVTESDLVVTQQQDVVNSEIRSAVVQKAENSEIINSELKSTLEVLTNVNAEKNVKILEEVKNIAQEIANINNEVAQEQNVEGSSVKSIQISGSLEQVPEGFLEYGPPGFREYGPPKGDELLRSSAVQEKTESQLVENNETRRRRFSPKLRTGTGKKH